MIVTLTIRPDHYELGNIRTTHSDPIALALIEKLDLSLPKDIVAVGTNEIYLNYNQKHYTSKFDVLTFHKHMSDKSRNLRLVFSED